MRLELTTMSPNAAADLLAASIGQPQRKLNQNRVAALADAIRRGQWRVTHQGIAVDPSGVVIDGQHRLSAIVQAGQAVDVLVAYDAEPETFDVIDIGRARNAGNILHFAGYADAPTLAAAARMLMMYDRMAGTTLRPRPEDKGAITPTDILDFMESDRGARLLSHAADGSRIARHLGRNGARTWLQVALTVLEESGAAEELRTEFSERLEHGDMLPSTSPILGLRRWIMSGDTGYVRIPNNYRANMSIAAVIKAWNLWIMGRSVRVFAFKVGVEITPVALARRPEPEESESNLPDPEN